MRNVIAILVLWNLALPADNPALVSTFAVDNGVFDKTAVSVDSLTTGLQSNVIAEIQLQGDSLVWIGTGAGLSLLRDSVAAMTFTTGSDFTEGGPTDYLPSGGISAIAAAGDTLFVATATTSETNNPMGNGFVWSTNSTDTTISWTYFSQPTEGAADSLPPFAGKFFRALPVTVEEFNVTYDASISGNYIWIASWAGGLRRYDITNSSWGRVPLPKDNQTALNTCDTTEYEKVGEYTILEDFYLNPRNPSEGGNHNHKAFSVLAYSDTVWVGTANGINRGILGTKGCISWEHYAYPSENLSGNFVVSLARQNWNGQRIIWAATVNADDPTETRGLSYTTNDGGTWVTTLLDKRVYNITAYDSLVFAATSDGIWKSEDGKTWAKFKGIKQAVSISAFHYELDEILTSDMFSVAFDSRMYYPYHALWIGSMDGLARSFDLDGSNWKIYRTNFDQNDVYAYPNPFSPDVHNVLEGDGYVRFHTNIKQSYVVNMDVYNFAMELVYSYDYDRRKNSGALKWNGRDQQGNLVSYGTYFVRLQYDSKSEWVSLIVIK